MPGMHPYSLRFTQRHPLARMLPLQREQMQVYRLGEAHPPIGELAGHGPVWEVASFVLASRDSLRARINLQRDYYLMAITVQSSVQTALGGFRAQLYDTKKQVRFADRGVLQANISGTAGGAALPGAFFLREPYPFDQPDSQILVVVQNMENAANTIQVALYGQVLRFNEPRPDLWEFPGGVITSVQSN